jgi:hypothetical protein
MLENFSTLKLISLCNKNRVGLVALFLVVIFWVVAASPLILTNDSFLTLDQVYSGKYDNFPTVAYTLYVKLLSINWHFPWLLAVLQSLLVVAALLKVLTFIDKNHSLSTNSKLILVSLLQIFPFFGGFGVTLWKDIPYASLTVIGVILLFESANLTGLKFKFFAVGILILGSSFRHDGWPSLFIFLVLIIAKVSLFKYLKFGNSFKKNKLRLIGLLFISISFTIVLGNILVTLTNAKKIDSWWNVAPLVADLAYVSTTQPEKLPPEVNSQIASFTEGSSKIGAAVCQSVSNMVYSEGFKAPTLNLLSNKIWSEFPRLLLSKAGPALVKAHLCRSKAFIPFPLSFGPSYVYWVTSGIPMTEYNHHHLQVRYYFNRFSTKVNSFVTYSNMWFGKLIWPGALLSLTYFLFLLNVVIRQKTSTRIAFLLLFVSARQIGLIIFGIAQDFRYAFTTYLICIPILLYLGSEKWFSLKEKIET